jgi:RNA polymerase sigma-70 factor (ECF subfamily)
MKGGEQLTSWRRYLYQRLSDDELALLVQEEQNQDAYDILMARYWKFMAAITTQETQDYHVSSDALISAQIRIWNALTKHRGTKQGVYEIGTDFPRWLSTVTANAAKETRRRQGDWNNRMHVSGYLPPILTDGSNDEDSDPLLLIASTGTSPHKTLENKDALKCAQSLIGRLGSTYRKVIFLRFIKGLSYKEIAQRMSIPLGTVKSRIFYGQVLLCRLADEHKVWEKLGIQRPTWWLEITHI